MDTKREIRIRGAKEHNLQNIDLDIPRDKFVVLTGLSGSGKSSLAFDTIYAEGQRRYMESLSSYARQFLGQMEKPDVESLEGLPPLLRFWMELFFFCNEIVIHLQFRLTRNRRIVIHVLRLVRLRKFMIISVFYMPELEFLIARSVARKSKNSR